MFSDVFQDVPVLLVGLGSSPQELDKIGDGAHDRTGRNDLADRFPAPFDDELFAAVAHPINEVRKGARGLGGRDMRFHRI